jgi:putative FmdB family regulatory protein
VPTYQYACTECGEQLEAVQSFSDPVLTECPACHGKLRKVFNSVGIVFKGSGFYRNDSRSGKVNAEKSNGAAESKSDSAKSDSGTPSSTGNGSSSSSSSTSATSGSTSSGSTKAPAAAS